MISLLQKMAENRKRLFLIYSFCLYAKMPLTRHFQNLSACGLGYNWFSLGIIGFVGSSMDQDVGFSLDVGYSVKVYRK